MPPPRASARLEALSDGVFALAATLLVVSLEVPRTYAELEAALSGFVPFAFSFAALLAIWSVHAAFFRRYGLADRITAWLNSCLLFVVLFAVYPLKFQAHGMTFVLFGVGPSPRETVRDLDELGRLFALYGVGFAAVFLLVALLYRHAARRAVCLDLDAAGLAEARFLSRHYAIFVGVGALSVALGLTGTGIRIGLPGWIYGALGPLCWAHGAWSARRSRRASETTPH